ncbi:hypothetical protein Vafri_12954, partial [Volvox africanus]
MSCFIRPVLRTMLSGILYLVRACFEVFYPRTMILSSTTMKLWSRVLCWRPRLPSVQQSSCYVKGSQTVVPTEIPSETDAYEAENEMQPRENGTESDGVDHEVAVFQNGDAQSIDSDIDHEVPLVEIGNNKSDTEEDYHEIPVAEIGDAKNESNETDHEKHLAEIGGVVTEENETDHEKHVTETGVTETGDTETEKNETDHERHVVEIGDTESQDKEMGHEKHVAETGAVMTAESRTDCERHVAKTGDTESQDTESRHVVIPTELTNAMNTELTNADVVEWVITYSKLEDEALGDRLIFQLAPEKYRNQGLKAVYDRLRWQVNPHRHPLGGQHRMLAFKAFEYLYVAYNRLEKN